MKSQAGTGSFKGEIIVDSARSQAVTDDAPSDIVAALSAKVAVDGGFDLSAAELDLTAQVETLMIGGRRFEPEPVVAALNWRGDVPLVAGKLSSVALTEGPSMG